MREYHYGVFIGRFQPLHVGHEHVIRAALEQVETLLIVVGSANSTRTIVNPFTYSEREWLLTRAFAHEVATGRIVIIAANDAFDDILWARAVAMLVASEILDHANKGGVGLHGIDDFKIALAGFGKDASSFYLDLFPKWGNIQLGTQHGTINASDIRSDFLRRLPRLPHDAVSKTTLDFLRQFSLTPTFKELVAERDAYAAGHREYGMGPFLTADALVTWRGRILLVTRGGKIGNGLLAIPGGFVNPNETFLQAALRELREETGLPAELISPHLDKTFVADNPRRSLRGRVVSVVHYFDVSANVELPTARGADDAVNAEWLDARQLEAPNFFEDHFHIIDKMLF